MGYLATQWQHSSLCCFISYLGYTSWTNHTFRISKFKKYHFVCIYRLWFIEFVLDTDAFIQKQGSQQHQWSEWHCKNLPSLFSQFLHPKHLSIPVETNRLALKPLQLEVIQCIYSEQCEVILTFSDSAWDQKDVQDYPTSHLLNHSSWQNLESRWNVQWSNAWPVGKLGDQWCRSLFQW